MTIRVKLVTPQNAPWLNPFDGEPRSGDVVCYVVVGRDGHGFCGPFHYDSRDEAIRSAVAWALRAARMGYTGSMICSGITLDGAFTVLDQYGALCHFARTPSLGIDPHDRWEIVCSNPDITITGRHGVSQWIDVVSHRVG